MSWTQRGSVVTASDAAASDNLGRGVALSGDGLVMAIGAPAWEGGASGQGGVYVFDWSGSAWVMRGSVMTASDAAANDNFGYSVALSDDGAILVVGANTWEGSNTDQGGVYVFDWSGSAWAMRGSVMTASDGAGSDYFGSAVALSGDGAILAVGAYGWEGSNTDQGGVYVYDWSGSAWVMRGSVLTASDKANYDGFGISVSLSGAGSVLAIGAYAWEGGSSDQGGVYVFDWSGSAWIMRGSVLTASDAESSDQFGIGVALSDDGTVLAVGAWSWDGTHSGQGGVYVFDWNGSAWAQRGSVLVAADPQTFAFFGASVAFTNDARILAVGAVYRDGAAADQGGVYVYALSTSALITVDSPLGAPAFLLQAGEVAEAPARPVPHQYILTAYLSGGKDATTDYAFQIITFGLSKRSAAVSYYSLSAPFSQEILDAFTARPNGLVHILRDGEPWERFNVGHPIRYDVGPRSSRISISGTRQETVAAEEVLPIPSNLVATSGIDSTGQLTLELLPGLIDPLPSHVITWEGANYTVSLQKVQAAFNRQTLTINAEAI